MHFPLATITDVRIREGRSSVSRDAVSALVEHSVTFPDSQVGGRFVTDCEASYLTVVNQDGEGKIDVWDDRTPDPYPNATATPAP